MKDVLRYLGIKGEADKKTIDTVKEMRTLCQSLTPSDRSAYFEIIKINDGIKLKNTDVELCGNLVQKHFFNCKAVVLIIATLSLKSEILLQQVFAKSSQKAVVLDAVLTDELEKYLDKIEMRLRDTYGEITSRISCGYGDLNISKQKNIFDLLDGKSMGIVMKESFMMVPNKSVIAMVGVR